MVDFKHELEKYKMAKKTTALAKREKPGALVKYDEEFLKYAKDIASRLTIGGTFISLKSGIVAIGGKPVEGNKLKVIIVDNVHVNSYFDHPYDEDDKSPPNCFALGREEGELEAHVNSKADWQNRQDKLDETGKKIGEWSPCAGCKQNVMGSSDRSKGKACQNTERLAVISAEELDKDSIKNGEVLYVKLSVMNRKPFALYAKGLLEGFKRPPFGVITDFGVVPDKKTQFRVTFEMDALVPKELAGVVIARHVAELPNTAFPWQSGGAATDGKKEKGKKGKKEKAGKKGKAGRERTRKF
jgi:hypothetical protein